MAAWLAKNGHTADEPIFDSQNNVLETYSSGDSAPAADGQVATRAPVFANI